MINPTISVVIPVYNGTNYLREAIESVLAQTYTDYEVLVVDDGSTDGTWELIQSFGDRVRGFRKPNGGVASALNLGLKEMHGHWFAWLSHDDLWLPEKLEKQVTFLKKNHQFSACYTDYFEVDAKGNILKGIETPWYPRPQSMRALFGRMYIGGCTMMVDRVCFDRVGFFNENLRTTQDVEMWFRILQFYEIGRLAEKLTKERHFSGQGSRIIANHEAEKMATYTQIFKDLDVAMVFPELAEIKYQPRKTAQTYTWLGNTMAFHRDWYTFADEQFRRSVVYWPSWQNPAKWRVVFGSSCIFLPKRIYLNIRRIISGFHQSGKTNESGRDLR